MKEQERKELTIERDARLELVKRLTHPLNLLKQASAKEKAKRVAKIDKLKKFDNYEEAHDAWGWELITDEELEEAKDFFEKGEEYINKTFSVAEVAESLLCQFIARLKREAGGIEFELLPPAEQARILAEEEKRRKEREAAKR